MSELEKAARALVLFCDDNELTLDNFDDWMSRHFAAIDALRAALEAEAGWEDIGNVSLGQAETFAALITGIDGDRVSTHKYRIQRRPLVDYSRDQARHDE